MVYLDKALTEVSLAIISYYMWAAIDNGMCKAIKNKLKGFEELHNTTVHYG